MAKRLVAFCFGVCALTCVSGQSYYPFPMDSAYWSVEEYFHGWFPEPDGCITRHYGIFKDSAANGITYSTLYGNNLGGPPYHDSAFNYHTAVEVAQVRREDTSRKVWVDDILYYDFGLDQGDGFCFDYWSNAGCGYVWLVDSISIDGKPRRRIHFNTTNPETWIEGIGSTTGWLEWQWTGSWGWTMTCFYEKDRLVYGSSSYCHCNTYYTVVGDKNQPERIVIQTDQNAAKLQIVLPDRLPEALVKLYSMDGRLVQQCPASQSQIKFDIAHLPQGIFLVVVQGQNGITARKQVVKLSP